MNNIINDCIIRRETESERREVENLTREAFWNVYRPGCTEHYVLHCFRDRSDFVPELDLVMEKDGRLIGHVMYVRSHIDADDGRSVPIMTFGPISIAPEYKRRGYGSVLLRRSMDMAREMGAGALAITGNIGFYGKSGFVVASTLGIHYYAEPREAEVPYFLARELEPAYLDAVSGVYRDPEGYFVDDGEAEAFDRQFPPREKLRLPGQLW
ncbi:MAG: N-acetyltransferase [Oscillospiraceae bacterium]|nr:N-acetyltransferase [Oscillospiraceae bacterium]